MSKKTVERRLTAIENTLKRKCQCLICGFDQGDPNKWCGTSIPEAVQDHLKKLLTGKSECSCFYVAGGDWWKATFRKQKAEYDRLSKPIPPAPAPPLHVRVAQALEYHVWRTGYTDDQFRYDPKNMKEGKLYPLIPRYDESVELAERAATTYFNKHNRKWGVCHLRPPDDYYQAFYFVDFEKDRSNFVCGDTAAKALSLLIDKHNEGVK